MQHVPFRLGIIWRIVILYLIIDNCGAFNSLLTGKWMKLICGASNQEVASIRNLCYIYTAAGVDCIDLAADSAVINAAYDGIKSAMLRYSIQKPYVMISVNDGHDAHFRKASFNADLCPSDCPRPCEKICPAIAIDQSGVIDDRCYGCGRCLKVCPFHLISEKATATSPESIIKLFRNNNYGQIVDAIEVHTNQSHEFQFFQLVNEISDNIFPTLKVLAISCPDFGKDETIQYLSSLQHILTTLPRWNTFKGIQIWQTDGNPMSGDILRIPSYRSFSFAQSLLTAKEASSLIDFSSGKHFVQLSGGINEASIIAARKNGLASLQGFGGFGVGGFARKLFLEELYNLDQDRSLIENNPVLCRDMIHKAQNLVNLVKS